MLREQIDERRELLLDVLQVAVFLDRHFEEGTGVAGGGGLVRHRWAVCRLSGRSTTRRLFNSPDKQQFIPFTEEPGQVAGFSLFPSTGRRCESTRSRIRNRPQF